MAEPLVSIVVPFRNGESTLAVALRSLQRQSLVDFECLLVDDGSTDGSVGIAQALARQDSRFCRLSNPGVGLVSALNRGVECSRAALVARFDADDICHRHRLRLQVQALDRSPHLAGVGCHVRMFPRRTLTSGMRRYEAWLNALSSPQQIAAERFVESPLVHPTLCVRRDVLLRFGYVDRGWPEDYDLLLRLLEEGQVLDVVPRRLLAWRDRSDRQTRSDPRCAAERIVECKAFHLAQGLLRGHERYVLWGYGDTGRVLRRALLRFDKQPAYIVERHPRRIGQRIHGAAVVPPGALAQLRQFPVVVSVAGAENRRLIRADLHALGLRELTEFVCAA